MNILLRIKALVVGLFTIVFGLCVALVVLESGLHCAGLVMSLSGDIKKEYKLTSTRTYTIMCLGDSTTRNQYPAYLEEALKQKSRTIKFKVIDKGVSGTTTAAILSRLKADLDEGKPDMVVTMMGINDGPATQPYSPVEALRKNSKLYKLYVLANAHLRERLKLPAEQEAVSPSLADTGTASESLPTEAQPAIALYDQGRLTEAEALLKKLLPRTRHKSPVYIRLGDISAGRQQYGKARELYAKALEINPKNIEAYRQLGRFSLDREEYSQAQYYMEKAIGMGARGSADFQGLANAYLAQGRIKEAQKCLARALRIHPEDEALYASLGHSYRLSRNTAMAEDNFERAEALRLESYNPGLDRNYGALADAVLKRKIALVCMQYPLRSIQPLKKMLAGRQDIVFVSNEEDFRRALDSGRYRDFFRDARGGDFGHCTEKGNRLIAEHLADSILESFH